MLKLDDLCHFCVDFGCLQKCFLALKYGPLDETRQKSVNLASTKNS